MAGRRTARRERKRSWRLFAALLVWGVAATPVASAGELDIAKEALRDGLWEVARAHAEKAGGDEGRFVTLESYAREERWGDLLARLDAWQADGEGYVYYRALALAETGRTDEADALLRTATFADDGYAALKSRLRAQLALASGDSAAALKILKDTGFGSADDAKLDAARVLEAAGDRKGAEALWREIVAKTNVDERIYVTAAVNLGEADGLRTAYRLAQSADLRRLAAFRLGRALIATPESFDEGATLIRKTAVDAPDATGARDAYLALADAYLADRKYDAATNAYGFALVAWPDAAKMAEVHEGYGWALRKLGRFEDAVAAFARAEAYATNDTARANAVLEQGDAWSENGDGEKAMAKYRLVLEKYPKTPAGEKLKVVVRLREMEEKARELYRSYDFEGASKAFAKLADEDPSRKPLADYFEVLCLYGQLRDEEALAKAREIADNGADPAIRAEVTLWIAKFAYNARQWGESSRLFASYADQRPNAPQAPAALVWAARAAFADNDFEGAVKMVTKLVERYPASPERARGYLIQGESLIELARFDEAVLVLERAMLAEGATDEDRFKAQVMKADALFVMGADNPARYREALDAYRAVRQGEALSPDMKIAVSFKIGRTLEKLKRSEDAIDQFYSEVVVAYREGIRNGVVYGDEAGACFAKAAFLLADEYESRGKDFQAMHVLELVVASDVPASDEAEKRIDRIQTKGRIL